jgi:hypothetical protein
MKKAAIAVTLALCSISYAQSSNPYKPPRNYTYFASTEDKSAIYVDWSTVKRESNYVKAWVFWVYQKPQPYLKTSFKGMSALNYFDCEKTSYFLKTATLYGDGDPNKDSIHTTTAQINPYEFVDIAPGTILAYVIDEVCKVPK